MTTQRTERHKVSLYEGPAVRKLLVAVARASAFVLAGEGALAIPRYRSLAYFLFLLAFLTAAIYLLSFRKGRRLALFLAYTQVLMDFVGVATIINFTGGLQSSYTFLMVIIILEGGLVLGWGQGFLFATLATLFMGAHIFGGTAKPNQPGYMEQWYSFLIQGMAFYLTAFVSGYWNQRINRMEQFQRRILDNMNSGFLMTDRQGIITGMNRAAHQILELDDGAAIGRNVSEVLEVAGGGECPVTTALRSQRDFLSYEFRAQIEGERTKLMGLTTSHMHNTKNATVGIIATFTDLTEMARMRQELQSQDRLAAVGELAAGLAHEIRNPVAAIRGAVDELPSSMQSPMLAEKLIAIALRECDHLNKIVTGFLDFARSPSLSRETFDLRELIGEVRELMERQYGRGDNLVVDTTVPGVACPVSGDRAQIRLVFINLAKNAIEAMHERGRLNMALSCGHGSYEARFDDEGPGIHPDKVARIFDPFYTEKEKGIGMGLAICLRIVTAHDGTIRVTSRATGGTTMVVGLPAAQPKEHV